MSKRLFIRLALVAALLAPFLLTPAAGAQVDLYGACKGTNEDSGFCKNKDQDVKPLFSKVVDGLMTILGVISIIVLVYGGFRYVTSGGDSNKLSGAKNTILYAIVGIVIALLAYAIVNFVYLRIS